MSSLVADAICDQSLLDKAIAGRLGLFIKKMQGIESDDDLSLRPHQVIIGKNYENLVEFACSWCLHKTPKVRQNALKMIVEICRINNIDSRGAPFK